MAKMIAGEMAGEAIFGATVAGEMTNPFTAPLAIAELLGFGIYKAVKHHKEKKKNEQEKQQKDAEEQWLKLEDERKAKEAEDEWLRLENERRAQEEEQRRVQQEQQRQSQYQSDLNQRQQENQDQINQAVIRDVSISDQLEQDRVRRLRGQDVQIEGYAGRSEYPDIARWFISPALLQNDDEPDESWRLISGSSIVDREYPNYSDEAIRQRQRLDPPPPDSGPNNGGNGDPSGPNNPGGNNNNNGFPDQNGDRRQNLNPSNPYSEIIKEIARQIQQNKNREKPPVEPPKDNPESENQPLGSDPATWSPSQKEDQQILGKGGAGTWTIGNPALETPDYIKNNDDTHLVENELLALINGQGMSEQNQEAIIGQQKLSTAQYLNEMSRIEQSIPQPTQIDYNAVYSSDIVRF